MPLCHPKRGRVMAKAKPDFKNLDDTVKISPDVKSANIRLNLLPPPDKNEGKAKTDNDGVDQKLIRQRQMQI